MKHAFIVDVTIFILWLVSIVGISSLSCTVTPAESPILREFKVELYCKEKVIRTWAVNDKNYPTIWRATTDVTFYEKDTNKKVEIVGVPEGTIVISEI